MSAGPDSQGDDVLTQAELAALKALVGEITDDHDPVAIRLGLVGNSFTSRFDELALGKAIADDIPTLPGGVEFDLQSDGTVICTSISDRVWIVPHERGSIDGSLRAGRAAFADDPRITAVVLYDVNAGQATSLTFSESFRSLEPGDGWAVDDHLPLWSSLHDTLLGFFEQTLPRWEALAGLEQVVDLDEVDTSVLASSTGARDQLAAQRPRLPHKQDAREFVLGFDAEQIAGWVRSVQGGELSPRQLADQLIQLVEERG